MFNDSMIHRFNPGAHPFDSSKIHRPLALPLPKRYNSFVPLKVLCWTAFALIGWSFTGLASVPAGFGGFGLLPQSGDCIPAHERQRIEENIRQFSASFREPQLAATPTPASYPFVPVAGTAWLDRFINNFVDLDPSAGILDWDCTDFTYDGHLGHDLMLRTFNERSYEIDRPILELVSYVQFVSGRSCRNFMVM